MAFTILWRRQSKAAAILSPILGMATGIGVWLGTAQHFYGAVSVSATGQILPCVYGTVASACSPILYSVVITLIKPQKYDWSEFRKEKLALERLNSDLTTVHNEHGHEDNIESGTRSASVPETKELKRWGRLAAFWSIATFLGHWVIWPLPMYGSNYVFGKGVGSHDSIMVLEQILTAHSSSLRGLLWRLSGCGEQHSSLYSIPPWMGVYSRLRRFTADCVEEAHGRMMVKELRRRLHRLLREFRRWIRRASKLFYNSGLWRGKIQADSYHGAIF